jgi:amino acid transporter
VLIRGVGLRGAVAINTITMIGIGPLITIPLVLGALHGPRSLVGWIAGAVLALCDGLVWAELGSRYPGSGGTYGYLRAVFGPHKLGALLSFIFVWQTIVSVPLLQASGYIGFANYAGYLLPQLSTNPMAQKMVAIGVGIVTLLALYRGITAVAKVGVVLAVIVLFTLACVIAAAFTHFSPAQAFALGAGDSFWNGLRAGFGPALIVAMYDYVGYGAANTIGDEVIAPQRTLPRAIVIAIGLVAAAYIALQTGVLGAIRWETIVPRADGSLPALGQYVASAVVERSFGVPAAVVVTLLILITAFASVYGNLLGFSRIPFAAASDGAFFAAFAHVHPRHRFPDRALLVIGLLALPACFFSLDAAIAWLTAGVVLIQPIGQLAALAAMRLRGERAPFRMWLYPVPALVALTGWIFVFLSSGTAAMAFGLGSVALAMLAFLIGARRRAAWPFTALEPRLPG